MEEMARRGMRPAGGAAVRVRVVSRGYLFTGDSLATALGVLRTCPRPDGRWRTACQDLTAYPQVLINVPAGEGRGRSPARRPYRQIAAVLEDVDRGTPGSGRRLGPLSGTGRYCG